MKIKSLFKNSFFSLLSQLILLLFGFLSQRAMNLYLGTGGNEWCHFQCDCHAFSD